MKESPIVVFITTKNFSEAEAISLKLLSAKLIACANIVREVKSFFWWQGKVDQADEALLIAKSRQDLLTELITSVKQAHSYSVPEVLALPIAGGNPDYLKWMDESLK